MSVTWRERIVAARERGRFTEEDVAAWRDARTCLVGEARAAYGMYFSLEMGLTPEEIPAKHLGDMGGATLQWRTKRSLSLNDFDAAEALLDAIEDRALALKRETFGASSDEATPTA